MGIVQQEGKSVAPSNRFCVTVGEGGNGGGGGRCALGENDVDTAGAV